MLFALKISKKTLVSLSSFKSILPLLPEPSLGVEKAKSIYITMNLKFKSGADGSGNNRIFYRKPTVPAYQVQI